MGYLVAKTVKPGEFLEDGDIVFDEAPSIPESIRLSDSEIFNGLGDEDLSTKDGPFSFTCTRREHSITQDGYHYFVVPDFEYEDLDFEGHTVLINDRPRLCSSFEVDEDGHIVIFVSSLSEIRNASKKG